MMSNWDLGLKIRFPGVMSDFYILMDFKSKREMDGANSPSTSNDRRFLGRTEYLHMKSVMKMRHLNFIYMYMSTYEVEAVLKDRCIILGNAKTKRFLGLVSDLYRALRVLFIDPPKGSLRSIQLSVYVK